MKSLLVLGVIVAMVAGDPFVITARDFRVSEDAKIGTVLGKVIVTSASPSSIRFEIKDNATKAMVKLGTPSVERHTASVELLVASALDRDFAPDTHTLHIVVSDGSQEVTRDIQMIISDVNDNAPIFTRSNFTETVHANAAVGTVVAIVLATDPDKQFGGSVTYSIQTTEPRAYKAFAVEPFTGMVMTSSSLASFAHTTFHFQVVATDGGGLSSSTNFVVTVV